MYGEEIFSLVRHFCQIPQAERRELERDVLLKAMIITGAANCDIIASFDADLNDRPANAMCAQSRKMKEFIYRVAYAITLLEYQRKNDLEAKNGATDGSC